MRVLHVAAVDFTTAKLLAPQLRELKSRGFDVRVATGRTDDRHWSELRDLDPVDLAFPRRPNPIAMLLSTLRLLVVVRRWRPDILHLHTPAASAPVRAIPRWVWPKRMRIFYTVHGYLHMWPPVGRREKIAQRLEAWLSHKTDVSLFQSAEDLDEARERGYGSDLVFLGNGVEDHFFDLPVPRVKPEGELVVSFVGRLVAEKGVRELLEALERVDGVTAHIVGDSLPSDRDGVSELVRERAAAPSLHGRVIMHGMLPRHEVQAVLAKTDLLVLPSYREGVPRSVIEALAGGRPVIATTIRGCRELVSPGNEGWLVSPRNVAELAQALEEARDCDEATFKQLSEGARLRADPDLRESSVVERLVRTYLSHSIA